MKQIYQLVILIIIGGATAFGQQLPGQPKINPELELLIPPSPTVAALMKFEEIPVNKYTGIPDINIPVFTCSSRRKDVSVNIKLSYHPADLQVSNTASWTGVGWSLMCGGTISRTVRGDYDNDMINGKGINSNQNPYTGLFFNNGAFVSDYHNDPMLSYMWDSYYEQRFDNERDIMQFNFNGISGKFYVEKSGHVVKLFNDSRIDIRYDVSDDSFTIYDGKGYKYVFGADDSSKEITGEYKEIVHAFRDGNNWSYPMSQPCSFVSAYQLSKVFDNNNKLLVTYKYQNASEIYDNRVVVKNELLDNNSIVVNEMVCPQDSTDYPNVRKLLPFSSTILSHLTIGTKKLLSIDVEGISRISFISEAGRQDLNSAAVRLKEILVKDWAYNRVKRFVLYHSYQGSGHRLVLDKVREYGSTDVKFLDTKLYYNQIQDLPDRFSENKDEWNYYNGPQIVFGTRTTNEILCQTGALQKMTIPTGGSYVLNWESNGYSYVGDMPETYFDNQMNRSAAYSFNNYHGSASVGGESAYNAFYLGSDQNVNITIHTLNSLSDNDKIGWYFELIPIVRPAPVSDLFPAQYNQVIPANYTIDTSRTSSPSYLLDDFGLPLSSNYFNKASFLQKGWYVIKFLKGNALTSPLDYTFRVDYQVLTDTYKYVPGGGIRIKDIGYFDSPTVEADYYKSIVEFTQVPHVLPAFEYHYNYDFFQTTRSSGALAYLKPLFSYLDSKATLKVCAGRFALDGTPLTLPTYFPYTFNYKITTDYNNLPALKTSGADVGYKNVTVTKVKRGFNVDEQELSSIYTPVTVADNGHTEYEYTSPIDFPPPFYDGTYPFSPSPDLDYKRGLLKKESFYDAGNHILKANLYNYEYEEDSRITGIKIYKTGDCAWFENYNSYGSYMNQVAQGNAFNCGDYFYLVNVRKIETFFGWAKLMQKITQEHFGANTTETIEDFDYYSDTKLLKLHSVSSNGSLLTKDIFFYNLANSDFSSNRAEIDHIDSYHGADLISKRKITYSRVLWGPENESFLPQMISASKGQQPLEPKVKFNRYDQYSNPLETQTENGPAISYLWGYNGSQIIAKVENATFSEVLTALNKTEADINAMTAAPSNIRDVLPNAMVTTLTYKPLVGVSSIADPKGDVQSFTYDDSGRLKEVKDKDGNILTANEYNYRTQNP